MSFSDGALLAGAILIVLGIARSLISLYEWNRDKKLLKNGVRTKGIF